MSFELRCRNCSRWLGESREPMKFRGGFESPGDRTLLPEPRDAWRCGKCGWVNVFRPYTDQEVDRVVELKSRPAA